MAVKREIKNKMTSEVQTNRKVYLLYLDTKVLRVVNLDQIGSEKRFTDRIVG